MKFSTRSIAIDKCAYYWRFQKMPRAKPFSMPNECDLGLNLLEERQKLEKEFQEGPVAAAIEWMDSFMAEVKEQFKE